MPYPEKINRTGYAGSEYRSSPTVTICTIEVDSVKATLNNKN
jgi:hypothetical protein